MITCKGSFCILRFLRRIVGYRCFHGEMVNETSWNLHETPISNRNLYNLVYSYRKLFPDEDFRTVEVEFRRNPAKV